MESVTASETIPTGELLALVREHATNAGWCSAPEDAFEDHLGITFKQDKALLGCDCLACRRERGDEPPIERFTPVDGSPTEVTKHAVTGMIRAVRRSHPGEARELIAAAGKKWGIDVTPAYRVRVTVTLDAEELEAEDSGWPVGEKGEPTDLKDDDLLQAARSAISDLRSERLTVRVTR